MARLNQQAQPANSFPAGTSSYIGSTANNICANAPIRGKPSESSKNNKTTLRCHHDDKWVCLSWRVPVFCFAGFDGIPEGKPAFWRSPSKKDAPKMMAGLASERLKQHSDPRPWLFRPVSYFIEGELYHNPCQCVVGARIRGIQNKPNFSELESVGPKQCQGRARKPVHGSSRLEAPLRSILKSDTFSGWFTPWN